MRILLTGGSGQLGRELRKLRTYFAPSHVDCDITDRAAVSAVLAEAQPDLILHAAAYTNTARPDVDADAAVQCWRTNVIGTRNLTVATCPIVLISTESALCPHNFYVCTKLQAELEVARHAHGHTIVRTSFRDDPFEYPRAATDMLTIGDSVPIIAKLIDAQLDQPPANGIVWLGTGVKTMYELARRTRPDVVGAPRADISPTLPSMEGLRDV